MGRGRRNSGGWCFARRFIHNRCCAKRRDGGAPARKPILLMAHMDVVPVDAATAKQWTHPPFAGTLAGEGGIAYVWGRGAGGAQKLLKERGTRFDFVLDEGLVITEGIIPGVAAPAALIGITQNGYMTVELAVRFAKGGHSSMPPKESVIGVLAEGVARIEISKPSFVVEPTRASSIAAPAFRALEKTVREIFPGAIVAPGLFTAHADAGYLDALADNVYLFSPVRVGPKDTPRFHGIDERTAVANYVEMIRFYHRLIQNTADSAGQ